MNNRKCYTPVNTTKGHRVVVVTENESGYRMLGKMNPADPHELDKWGGSYKEVRAKCDLMNKHLNISAKDESDIIASSMDMQLAEEEKV